MTTTLDLQQLIIDCTDATPQTILKQAFSSFGDELWLSFRDRKSVV